MREFPIWPYFIATRDFNLFYIRYTPDFHKKPSVYAKTCINIQLSLMLEDVRHAGRSSQDNKLLSQTLRIYMEG